IFCRYRSESYLNSRAVRAKTICKLMFYCLPYIILVRLTIESASTVTWIKTPHSPQTGYRYAPPSRPLCREKDAGTL
ncbi:MAG: hypothetical protein LBE89_05495, partial [Helicobacteraceae bacterium]|nr:hypothetical protein [Helicobacteraceae bacterium]